MGTSVGKTRDKAAHLEFLVQNLDVQTAVRRRDAEFRKSWDLYLSHCLQERDETGHQAGVEGREYEVEYGCDLARSLPITPETPRQPYEGV